VYAVCLDCLLVLRQNILTILLPFYGPFTRDLGVMLWKTVIWRLCLLGATAASLRILPRGLGVSQHLAAREDPPASSLSVDLCELGPTSECSLAAFLPQTSFTHALLREMC